MIHPFTYVALPVKSLEVSKTAERRISRGETFVINPAPDFKLLHVNRLGEPTLARRRWWMAAGISGRNRTWSASAPG